MYPLSRFDPERSQEFFIQTDIKLQELVSRLAEQIQASRIIVYGSYARRSVHEGSDIDIIIVGNFSERFVNRIQRILMMTDLPIEPLCYTEKEFCEMVQSENSLILQALEEGIDLV